MNDCFVALLGQRDSPTDAVEEYCRYLATALAERGIHLEIARIGWAEQGWEQALYELRGSAGKSANAWFLIQYTALAWSRRGFSWRVLSAIRLLKKLGMRVAMVFHDVEPYSGQRIVDRVRRNVQLKTMRQAARSSDVSIFTVPVEKVSWTGGLTAKTAFIPVGANLPAPERAWAGNKTGSEKLLTVGMFAVSSGRLAEEEAKLTANIFVHVTGKLGRVRLVVMGRNSTAAEQGLRENLKGLPVDVTVYGMLPAEEVVNVLRSCDAMLFLRGPISSRRGSAIAGIACGLPVIACEGRETAAPITEAGVVLIPPDSLDKFGPALLRVLEDPSYRAALAENSREAQKMHFCWRAIAARYEKILRNPDG